jgi:hypothetical protein
VSATLTEHPSPPVPVAGARTTATAIVLATGPMAAGPVLERLLGQLHDLGVAGVHVITRAISPDAASDLRAIAAIAREREGGLVVLHGDIVTNREALAGLLADPRIVNGALVARGSRRLAFGTRMRGALLASAGSGFHRASRPDSAFLGVLKVDAAQRELLAGTAERLAALAAAPPPAWEAELDRREQAWRDEGDADPAERWRATMPSRCCSSGSSAPGSRCGPPHCAAWSGRGRPRRRQPTRPPRSCRRSTRTRS